MIGVDILDTLTLLAHAYPSGSGFGFVCLGLVFGLFGFWFDSVVIAGFFDWCFCFRF